mmetsp:Transcript_96602/g.288405  ORF Transcript_96602/g.288405 Transcript_96602/m.288405 type:complete len:221 (+) Transcript_96602:1054-1716(+)
MSRASEEAMSLQSLRNSSSGSRAKRLLCSRPTLVDRNATSRPGASGTSSRMSSQASTSFSNPRMSCALEISPSASSSTSSATTMCRSASPRSSAERNSRDASSSWKEEQPRARTEAAIPFMSRERKNSSASNAALRLNSLNSIFVTSGASAHVGLGVVQSTSRHFGEICLEKGWASSTSGCSTRGGGRPLKAAPPQGAAVAAAMAECSLVGARERGNAMK